MKTKFRIPALLFMAAMLCTFVIVSCGDDDDKTPPPDLTALKASITAAQAKLDDTEQGKNDGQFTAESRTTLTTAIAAAQAVADNSATTQAEADGAKNSLDLAVTAYNATVITPIAAENLVGYWTFNEGSGTTAKDASGNGLDGLFKEGADDPAWGGGVPTYGADRTGAAGKALVFDKGSNVEIPYNTKLNPAKITVSVWINPAETRENNRFLGLHSWLGYKYQLQSTNRPYFTINTDAGIREEDATVSLLNDEWHHIVATFGDGKLTFYIDGVMTKEWEKDGNGLSLSAKPYNIVIGQDFPTDQYAATADNYDNEASPDYQKIPLAWGGYFHGSLDELRIYNTVLSATQVQSLYDREKP